MDVVPMQTRLGLLAMRFRSTRDELARDKVGKQRGRGQFSRPGKELSASPFSPWSALPWRSALTSARRPFRRQPRRLFPLFRRRNPMS